MFMSQVKKKKKKKNLVNNVWEEFFISEHLPPETQ